MPIETSVSIVAAPWRRFAHAARWKGQRAPGDHRGGQREREPLPAVELQRRDHRQHDDRHRQHDATMRTRSRSAAGSSWPWSCVVPGR